MEPLEQGEVSLVADGVAIRVQRNAEFHPEDGRESSRKLDRQRVWIASLRACDPIVTYAYSATDFAQTQAA